MSFRLKYLLLYVIGFILLIVLMYFIYNLGIDFGRLIHNVFKCKY